MNEEFNDLQKRAAFWMIKYFQDIKCNWQIISHDKAVESYSVTYEGKPTLIIIHYSKKAFYIYKEANFPPEINEQKELS
jgi:hypothetical protein